MAFSLHGIKVPHRKNTADMPAVRIKTPETVTLPMAMHIGKPAIPCVKVGDTVFVGTLIGEQDGFVSSPVYSSVSGKVIKIADTVLSSGASCAAVTIESDGEMTPDPALQPPVIENREDMLEAIRKSGMVGLGGAGFPTYVKFNVKNPIEELVINGAECEPYITSDSLTMTSRADDMALAISMLEKFFNINKVIIGIEKNKPAAIASMLSLAEKDPKISVKSLPSVYPQGGEKVLVYHTTGKKIGRGKLPIDVGCVVCNCTTVASIGAYIKTGMPFVEKCITVDGSAVKEPKNVIVPIGTSLGYVFDACGGFKDEPAKIIYGGPMMGISVPDADQPVLKNTNAILAFNEKDSVLPEETACIKCGTCLNNCPFGLSSCAISKAYKNKDAAALEKLGVDLCMECGCCSYGCPAGRPLVQTNRLAKAFLREEKEKAKAAEKAKEANK